MLSVSDLPWKVWSLETYAEEERNLKVLEPSDVFGWFMFALFIPYDCFSSPPSAVLSSLRFPTSLLFSSQVVSPSLRLISSSVSSAVGGLAPRDGDESPGAGRPSLSFPNWEAYR